MPKEKLEQKFEQKWKEWTAAVVIHGEDLKKLQKDRENHFDVIPAFRLFEIVVNYLPPDFKFNKLKGKFAAPVADANKLVLHFKKNKQGNLIKVKAEIGDYTAFYVDLFTNNKEEQSELIKQVNPIEDYSNIDTIEKDEFKQVLKQRDSLIMLDRVGVPEQTGNTSRVVGFRDIKKEDFEGRDKFNKYRLEEMLGQVGSWGKLRKVNVDEANKVVTYREINTNYFPGAENIKLGDRLVIEIMQNEEDISNHKATGVIRKIGGQGGDKIILISTFTYFDPINVSDVQDRAKFVLQPRPSRKKKRGKVNN
jgi:hypothetical protein